MIDLSATVDGAAVSAFNEALRQYGDSLGKSVGELPRRAAIQVCKNFRANTRTAKKNRPITVSKSEVGPKWITYSDGRKLPSPKRRYNVVLTDRNRKYDVFVGGNNPAEMRKDIRSKFGTNYFQVGDKGSPQKKGGKRRLAQRSWGWVMHNIFAGAAPAARWQKGKRDRRNPVDAVRDSYSVISKGAITTSGLAKISNRLDYIRDALKISEDSVLMKAASAIVRIITTKRLRKAGGMTAAEIRAAAKAEAEELKRRFPLNPSPDVV